MAPPRSAKRARTEASSAGIVALHRSRFIEWQPSPVVALAASGDASVVAAAREDGDIELYETATNYCFQRIPGHQDSCLTCVALVDEEDGKGGTTSRLFSGGLDGALSEWDVEQRRAAAPAADSLGGAVWQLAAEPGASIKPGGSARLAAACDDGCARIFVVDHSTPGLTYAKSLPRTDGRTLAVAWHPSGQVLATAGTDGCIHLWSLENNHELLRITAGGGSGAAARGESCIWALLFLPDGNLVSGDSSGAVQFWDGRFGTRLARFQQHAADVLALAASPDGNSVFAAGVDPQVAIFGRLGDSDSAPKTPWAYLSTKRPHTHDVRALCIAAGRNVGPEGPRLFTGGNDTQLYSHSVARYQKEHPVKVCPCPQLPLLHAAQPPPLPGDEGEDGAPPAWLLCAQRTQLDIWQLGGEVRPAAGYPVEEGALLEAAAPPELLVRLAATGGCHVSAACISRDGRWLAYADTQRVACFALEQREADDEVDDDHVLPVELPLPADLPPACQLAFRPGADELLACAADGTIRIVSLAACQRKQRAAAGMANGVGSSSNGGDSAGLANGVGGGGGGEAVQAVRAVHDLQYKSSLRRDRQRSAARRLMPLVEHWAVSPDGSWLAVVVRQRPHLLSLTSHKLVHSLPPLAEPQPPLTAIAFTADSSALVIAAATHQVAAYSVHSGQPTEWTQRHCAALPAKLLKMPGAIAAIASCPAAPHSLFLASGEACCHLDMSAAPEDPAVGGGVKGGKRRRVRPVQATEPPGANCRMIYCADPVLHADYLGPDALLVVERPWAEVFRKVAAPMYRHRYGT